MDFLHQIKLSFIFYWRSFRFIDSNDLWKLLIIPSIISLLIAFVIIVFAIKTSGVIVELFMTNFQATSPDKTFHSFIEGLLCSSTNFFSTDIVSSLTSSLFLRFSISD